jgi:hypothetical protein
MPELGTPAGDDVLVDLDAWHIGSAFDAAEDAGLLPDLRQPDGPRKRLRLS